MDRGLEILINDVMHQAPNAKLSRKLFHQVEKGQWVLRTE